MDINTFLTEDNTEIDKTSEDESDNENDEYVPSENDSRNF